MPILRMIEPKASFVLQKNLCNAKVDLTRLKLPFKSNLKKRAGTYVCWGLGGWVSQGGSGGPGDKEHCWCL